MVVLFASIAVLLLAIDYLRHRNIFSPVFLFTALWTFIVFLAALQLYGFTGYSSRTVSIVLIGVICFASGCLLIDLAVKGKTQHKNKIIHKQISLHTNERLLCIVTLLCCIGSVILLINSIRVFLAGGTYVEVRGNLLGYSDDVLIQNSLLNVFLTYFCGPAKSALLPLAVIFLFRRTHPYFVLATFLCIASDALSSGGRITILYVALFLMAAFRYYHLSIPAKIKRIIIGLIIAGVVVAIVLTTLRSNQSLFQSIYAYFTIPIALLTKFNAIVDQSDFFSFGGAFLYPLFYLIDAFANLFGTHSLFLEQLVYLVNFPQNTWVSGLFPTGSYNAFCTMFYYFYMDFRMFGVAAFCFIYGIICEYIYFKAYTCQNDQFFPLYLLILQSLFGSFIIWQLGSTKFVLSLAILLILQFKISSTRPRKRVRVKEIQ